MASVAEILNAAADLLEKPGAWTQGVWARNASGRAVSPFDGDAQCFCMRGALCLVTKRGLAHGMDAERRALGFSTDAAMARWNDKERRTQAEVVAALREAALRSTHPTGADQ